MVHPGLFIGLVIAKKAIAVSIYYSLKQYGFAKFYRRLLEANKRLTPTLNQQMYIKQIIKSSFYFPNKASEYLQQTEVIAFIKRYSTELQTKKANSKEDGGVLFTTFEKFISSLLLQINNNNYIKEIFTNLQQESDKHSSKKPTNSSSSSSTLK